MFHTVSIEDAVSKNWLEVATFRWHADACQYAKEISLNGQWARPVRVRSKHHYADVVYFDGADIDEAIEGEVA